MKIVQKHQVLFLSVVFCLLHLASFSNTSLDSLTRLLEKDQNDTLRIRHLLQRGDENTFSGQYPLAIEDYSEALRLIGNDTVSESYCVAELGMGRAFNAMGNRSRALHHLQKCLSIARKKGFSHEHIMVLLGIGSVFLDSPNAEKCMEYFNEAETIIQKQQKPRYLPGVKTLQANYYYSKKEYLKALTLYIEVEKLTRGSNKTNHAGVLGNIGNVYYDLGDPVKAKEFQWRAIREFELTDDIQGQAICYTMLGELYREQDKMDSSLFCYEFSLKLSKQMNSWEDFIENYKGLSAYYKKKGEYKKALEAAELYKMYSDSVNDVGNTEKLTEMELTYKFMEQQREQELIQQGKDELAEEQIKRQRLITYAAIGGGILCLVILIMVFRISQDRKKSNEKLQQFNSEIITQKNIIEEKNKEITDSINYAERIQKALLNSESVLQKGVADHFILNRPKDIVSGDFYWTAEKFGKLFVVVADCTGHGVPGAFMSMIGVSLLNELILTNGMHDPGKILNRLRDEVIVALNPKGSKEEQKDGMDMVLMVLDKDQLQFAAANNPLWLVRGGKLQEFKGDKQPVGKHVVEEQPFRTQSIRLEKNDRVYAFSDGFADQFGGPSGKKYKYRPLADLLIRIHELPMEEQKERMGKEFDLWKKDLQQVDDVLVVGIRI